MALDPRFIVAIDLQEYFVDKDTGQPLAFGTIDFYVDTNRVIPKTVYELTGNPPNYTYTPFPSNRITLSATGTVSDANGNLVPIYYFPYDANGNVQLYYIVVSNSNGVVQFTRQAWPNISGELNPAQFNANVSNLLTNPVFADIFFQINPNIINITGAGTTNVSICPGWTLSVVTTGNATVTVQQNAIAGSLQYPFNPPYTLTITPGNANISSITLNQSLLQNPDPFNPATGGINGYVSGSFLLAPNSTAAMYY